MALNMTAMRFGIRKPTGCCPPTRRRRTSRYSGGETRLPVSLLLALVLSIAPLTSSDAGTEVTHFRGTYANAYAFGALGACSNFTLYVSGYEGTTLDGAKPVDYAYGASSLNSYCFEPNDSCNEYGWCGYNYAYYSGWANVPGAFVSDVKRNGATASVSLSFDVYYFEQECGFEGPYFTCGTPNSGIKPLVVSVDWIGVEGSGGGWSNSVFVSDQGVNRSRWTGNTWTADVIISATLDGVPLNFSSMWGDLTTNSSGVTSTTHR